MTYRDYLDSTATLSFEERCEIREHSFCDWDNRRLRKWGKALDIFQGVYTATFIAFPFIFGILANMSGF